MVYIIGAGPGDPELITVKGARLISECPVILYTGSLVPKEVLHTAQKDAKVLDSAGMNLEEIIAVIKEADDNGQDVARVHTGDPSIYGSTAEQVRRLEEMGIEVETVPGVSSFVASAAALGKELTLPELSQTVIVTRCEGRTPMPDGEKLPDLAKHRATMVLFLSITLMKKVVEELTPSYGEDCPVAVVHKASMPEQVIITGTLKDIREKVKESKIRSQSMIIVGEVLTSTDFADSRLYAADFAHKFRKATKK
jgi:precorrin-4/cobalt-precorrin-4 C11-methyltransferase